MASKEIATRTLVLALVLMSPAVRAEGQVGTPTLSFGQRVRISSAAHRMIERVGTIIAVSEDTISVQVNTARLLPNSRLIEATDTVAMSRQSIGRVEVPTQGDSNQYGCGDRRAGRRAGRWNRRYRQLRGVHAAAGEPLRLNRPRHHPGIVGK